jgi:hypothetical protein
MKKFTSRLVTICLRVGIIFAVGIALIFSSELEFSGNKMQAIATPLTPEAKSYEVARPDRSQQAIQRRIPRVYLTISEKS